MPDRYYVIFYDPTNNTITFPMKAVSNPFRRGTPDFAGMPQFFGGNSNDRPRDVTLATEVTQESRGTYEFIGVTPPILYRNPDVGGSVYEFYVSAGPHFRKLRDDWPAATDGNTAEMSAIVNINMSIFRRSANPTEALNRLMTATGSTRAPGRAQFEGSQTAIAFTTFIHWWIVNHP